MFSTGPFQQYHFWANLIWWDVPFKYASSAWENWQKAPDIVGIQAWHQAERVFLDPIGWQLFLADFYPAEKD